MNAHLGDPPPAIVPMRASTPARRPRTARCAPSAACTSRTRSTADGAINVNELTVQRAFIQWAGFTLGRTASFVDPAGQLGDSGMRSLHQIQTESTTGASGINQIAYTWQLGNGVTLNVGADEERVRGLNNLSAGSSRTRARTRPATGGSASRHCLRGFRCA